MGGNLKELLASLKSSNYDAYQQKFLSNHREISMTHLTAVGSGDGPQMCGAGSGSDVPLAERTRERPRSEAV